MTIGWVLAVSGWTLAALTLALAARRTPPNRVDPSLPPEHTRNGRKPAT